jgi:hypothetical protein
MCVYKLTCISVYIYLNKYIYIYTYFYTYIYIYIYIYVFMYILDGTVDVHFEDGTEQKGFDMLVGADGIWSAIRAQMWGESSVKPGT